MSNPNTLIQTITISGALDEDLVQALAEGEHGLGVEATNAGWALIMFPGNDCPWGRIVSVDC